MIFFSQISPFVQIILFLLIYSQQLCFVHETDKRIWYINKIRENLPLLNVIWRAKSERIRCCGWRNYLNMKGYFNSNTTFTSFKNNLSPTLPTSPSSYTSSNFSPSFLSQRQNLKVQNFKPHVVICTSLSSEYHFPLIFLQSFCLPLFIS